jgi:hypothetical protein
MAANFGIFFTGPICHFAGHLLQNRSSEMFRSSCFGSRVFAGPVPLSVSLLHYKTVCSGRG